MDIISLQKSTKAKREMKKIKDRLGVGVQATYPNVKGRMEALESRAFKGDAVYVIDSDEDWNGGAITGATVSGGILSAAAGYEYVTAPKLTGATMGQYSVVSDSDTNGKGVVGSEAWKAFDGDNSTRWVVATNNSDGGISAVAIFDFGEEVDLSKIEIMQGGATGNSRIRRVDFYSSLNGVNYGTSFGNIVNQSSAQLTYNIPVTRRLRYLQIGISLTFGDSLNVTEIILTTRKSTNAVWESGAINLDGANGLDSIELTGTNTSAIKIYTDTGDGYVQTGSAGEIKSKYGASIKVKLELPSGSAVDRLSIKYKQIAINSRVSEVEKRVTINLNKHNLRVAALLNKTRYKMTDMIVDDFQDESGVDKTKSSNVSYDATLKKYTGTADKAELVTVSETLAARPSLFMVSQSGAVVAVDSYFIDLTKGAFDNAENAGSALQLKKEGEQYYSTGSWTSDVIDLGDNYKSFKDLPLTVTVPDGFSKAPAVTVMISHSADGLNFTEFQETDSVSSVGRYVKVKVVLTPGIQSNVTADIDSIASKDDSLVDKGDAGIRLSSDDMVIKRVVNIDTVTSQDEFVATSGQWNLLKDSTIILKRIVNISKVESGNAPAEINQSANNYMLKGEYK